MTIRSFIKVYFEKVTGLKIFRIMPIGIDPLYDVKRILRDENFNVFFDVGANIGQSAKKFQKYFPQANIFSFEPGIDSFKELELLASYNTNIRCYNIALSNKNERIKFNIDLNNPTSTMNSSAIESLDKKDQYKATHIEAKTLDFFCQQYQIDHIDYLKIDTEGSDSNVLKGADKMLRDFSIDIIQIEVGMNPTNKFHNPFDEIKQHLEDRTYYLFGIYEQAHEWIEKKPILRRCDALFVSKKIFTKAK